MASAAIEEAASSSKAVQASGSGTTASGTTVGASASTSSGTAKKDSTEQKSGQKTASSTADESSSMDVMQDWKGGASGVKPAEWRKSLDEATNSYWRIIDRYPNECIGIWHWIEDKQGDTSMHELHRTVCQAWRNEYFKRMGFTDEDVKALKEMSGDSASCSGAGDLRKMRVIAASYKQQKQAQASAKGKKDCEAVDGMIWVAGDVCRKKQCKCGSETGLTGSACPQDGAEACTPDQRAKCSTMSQSGGSFCGGDLVFDGSKQGELCVGKTCTAKADAGTCCKDKRKASRFTLKIHTKNCCGCGTDSTVKALVTGAGGESTGWWVLDKSGYDDFEQGDVDDYQVSASSSFIPTRICLQGDGWCLDRKGVEVYNAELSQVSGLIGAGYNFPDLDDHDTHCVDVNQR